MTTPRDIADELRHKIEDGTYTKRLPSRSELMAAYGVTTGTAMRATELLKEAGLVDIVHGAGVFVTGTYNDDPLADRIIELFRARKMRTGARVPTEKQLCQRLGVSRPKLRTALALLEGQGVIARQRIGQSRVRTRILAALPPDKEDE